jgi:hypothetical protein
MLLEVDVRCSSRLQASMIIGHAFRSGNCALSSTKGFGRIRFHFGSILQTAIVNIRRPD